jgi:DNA modification methylase
MHQTKLELPAPYWADELATIYCGDSLDILRRLPTGSVDAVITDPPYSSGGLMRSDRNLKTSDKYVLTGTAIERPEFFGDNRDQRSFIMWCSLWMAECLRIVKPGGYLFAFTDWRQLPSITDAVQVGGWVWKGVAVWDKEGGRPSMGWFRSQCEYVITCASGSMGSEQEREVKVCAPGVYRHRVLQSEKHHITGKPVKLMEFLMSVLPKNATVLGPFSGSFTTSVAAKNLNMRSIGIEMSPALCKIGVNRLGQQGLGLDFDLVPNDGAGNLLEDGHGEQYGAEAVEP